MEFRNLLFPFKADFIKQILILGFIAKENSGLNKSLHQLISSKRSVLNEIDIYTMDSSRSSREGEDCKLECAIFIPQFNETWSYKLNPLTSSFTAEAVDKAAGFIKDLVKAHS